MAYVKALCQSLVLCKFVLFSYSKYLALFLWFHWLFFLLDMGTWSDYSIKVISPVYHTVWSLCIHVALYKHGSDFH